MKYLLFPVLLLAALFYACQPQTAAPAPTHVTQSTATTTEVPADFTAFYERFLKDTAYQMAHIVWPVQGHRMVSTPDSSASVLQAHQWTPQDWVLHQPVDNSEGHYTRELSMLGDMIVIEKIKVKAANYGIERRFARQPDTGEWALIYYSSIREM